MDKLAQRRHWAPFLNLMRSPHQAHPRASYKTTLKLSATAAAIILSGNAAGLSLGELQVNSHLEQPLNGQINLSLDAGENLRDAKITLGTEEDYLQMGLDYPSYVKKLTLTSQRVNGANILRLGSRNEIIQEPFIQVLVRVEWGGGSFLREYTALIDPPSYVAGRPSPISVPAADQATQYEKQNNVSSAEPLAADSAVPTTVQRPQYTGNSTEYGPVAAGESLSLIANKLQEQFPEYSIYQIMQTLFEQNSDAFIDNNINRLAKGAVLRLDDLAAMGSLDVASARRFFFNEVNKYQDAAPAVASTPTPTETADDLGVAPDQLEVEGAEPEAGEPEIVDDATSEGRFQVASGADSNTGASSLDATDVDPSANGETTQQVAELQASLTSKELENQALKDRVARLEQQFADLSRLANLEVESNELANLEARLAEQNSAAEVDEGSISVVTPITEEGEPAEDAVEQVSDAEAQQLAQQSEPNFLSKVTGGNPLLAALGALLLGLLGLFAWRKLRSDDDDLELSFHSTIDRGEALVDEGLQDRDTSFVTVYAEDESILQAEQVDPIAEADVYLAYGRDEQAETVLLTGIKNNPDQLDIKEKLLGLYHKTKNADGFKRVAADLYGQKSLLTPEIWAGVSMMGRELLPDEAMFDESSANLTVDAPADTSTNEQAESATDELDMDDTGPDGDGIAVDEHSFYLVNFDDGHSEISELDEVKLDSLGFNVGSIGSKKSGSGQPADTDSDVSNAASGDIEFENVDIKEQKDTDKPNADNVDDSSDIEFNLDSDEDKDT